MSTIKRLIQEIRGLDESIAPTVSGFLDWLMGSLTQYDQRQAKNPSRHNPYALGHYAKGVQDLRDEFSVVKDSQEKEDLERLKKAITKRFMMAPADRAAKAIDDFLTTGKAPLYPGTRSPSTPRPAGAPKKPKLPTFPEARAALLKYLDQQGWAVKAHLKVPQATEPHGEFRLWFKPQAVYYTQGRSHDFGDARTISYSLDIRTMLPDEFLIQIKKWFKL